MDIEADTDRVLDELLDAACATAFGPAEDGVHYGYLLGMVDAVAAIRAMTAEALLADVRRRMVWTETSITPAQISAAVAAGELLIHYQPKVSLRTDMLVGMEALVRWEHPRLGLLGPDSFIRVAERGQEIAALGRWVLHRACADAAAWRTSAGDALFVSVNVSARQFTTDLVTTVREALAATGCRASSLVLEITETTAMADPGRTREILEDLADLGVQTAIDDFGTGYSSLAYLRRFPLHTIKIDRTFIDGLGREPEDMAIVAAMISMAHSLGRSALAEGVETAVQLERLRMLGCDMAQGFYFAAPMPAEDTADLVRIASRGEWVPARWQQGDLWERPRTGPSVLVVDDNADMRFIVATALGERGYIVHEAADGAAALAAFARGRVECVVLDVDMPGMSGLDVLRHLRQSAGPDVAVVILTGSASFEAKAEAYALGADDFIRKPITANELLSRIAAVLRSRPSVGSS